MIAVNLQKNYTMKGLLKENSEIEKLKKEYQKLAEINFEVQKITITQEELVLEDCES